MNMFQYFINLLYTYYTSIYRFLTNFLRISNDSNKYIGTTCSSRFDSFFKIKERTTFKDIFSIPSVLVYELNQSLRTIRKKKQLTLRLNLNTLKRYGYHIQCLHVLTLLSSDGMCSRISHTSTAKHTQQQENNQWRHG